MEAEALRRRRNKLARMFPAEGPFRRELYPKHLQFFAAGKEHMERAFIAGNRTGKTEAGAYEMALHLTGLYPDWWEGRRFPFAIKAWAAGDTAKTVRDIIQEKLLGKPGEHGTGMIPGDLIIHKTAKQGMAEAIDTIYVKHVSGGRSAVTLKTYMEGRESFQGAGIDFCWLDESVEAPIYDECLIRLMTTEGALILTFTPLQGLTEIVLRFLPGGKMVDA
jgi:phage terminase large subunit-like protein